MEKRIEALRGHVVLAGLGRGAWSAAQELAEAQAPSSSLIRRGGGAVRRRAAGLPVRDGRCHRGPRARVGWDADHLGPDCHHRQQRQQPVHRPLRSLPQADAPHRLARRRREEHGQAHPGGGVDRAIGPYAVGGHGWRTSSGALPPATSSRPRPAAGARPWPSRTSPSPRTVLRPSPGGSGRPSSHGRHRARHPAPGHARGESPIALRDPCGGGLLALGTGDPLERLERLVAGSSGASGRRVPEAR